MGKGTDMSRTIWKSALLPQDGVASVHMDVTGKPLCVQLQNGVRTLWFESEKAPLQTADRYFYVLPTGFGEIPDDATYVGTVQDAEGFVWHVYEKAVTV